ERCGYFLQHHEHSESEYGAWIDAIGLSERLFFNSVPNGQDADQGEENLSTEIS
ncbi:hypothetical protein NPIL_257371, partial [Nephila pilipes]